MKKSEETICAPADQERNIRSAAAQTTIPYSDIPLNDDEFITDVNFGLKIIQNRRGLLYGTDAFLLSAFMRNEAASTAVEIGSGSGIISLLAIYRNKFKQVFDIEIQPYYSELNQKNIRINGMQDRIKCLNIDARYYNLEKADVVFMNPPYMKIKSGKENEDAGKYAARHEVNGTIFDLCGYSSNILKYGGSFYCVYRPDRLSELFRSMSNAQIEPKRITFVHNDAQHDPSLVMVYGKKNGKEGMKVTKPLILFDENGKQTNESKAIYKKGVWFD